MGQSRFVGVGVGGLGRLIYTHTPTSSSPVSYVYDVDSKPTVAAD